MAPNRFYSSNAVETTVSSSISSGAASVAVTAVTGFPSSTPFTIIFEVGTANEEIAEVTNVAGTTFTINRGIDGSSALSHTAGAKVVHGVSARDLREPQEHIGNTLGVHGLGGATAIVGTDTAQTLSNKTINAPTITNGGSWAGGPTINVPVIGDFTGAQHNHGNAAGGGNALVAPVITGGASVAGGVTIGSGATITGGGSWAGSPTFTATPTIADLTNIQHDHATTAKGGSITQAAVTGLVAALAAITGDITKLRVSVTTTSQVGSPSFTGGPNGPWNAFSSGNWPALTFTTPAYIIAAVIIVNGAVINTNTASSSGAVSFTPSPATGLDSDPFTYALEAVGGGLRASRVQVVTGLAASTAYTFTPAWRMASSGAGTQTVSNSTLTVLQFYRV